MSTEDASDWTLARNGDEQALARLFSRHSERLFRHAFRLLNKREDAKEAVVIAFFELWRRRAAVRVVDGSPLPWLLNTVSNAARNLERSSRRYQRLLARLQDVADSAPEFRTADESGALAALKRLPPREQHVVVLSVLEGYPHGQIATVLGVSVGTVKSRLSRAKGRLRDDLAHVLDDGGGINVAVDNS